MKPFVKVLTTRAEATSWAMSDAMVPAHMVAMTVLADASRLHQLREMVKARGEVAPSYTALVIKATAMVLHHNPEANRAILGLPFFQRLYQFKNTDITVAVERELPGLPGQPFAPTVKNTLEKSLAEITRELQHYATCAVNEDDRLKLFMRMLKYVPRPISNWLINAPYLSPSLWAQHRGCAAWVNAPSRSGADLVVTTWPWPITFSFGMVKERPFIKEGRVVPCMTIPLLMSFDRRIQGGGPAGRIFAQFKDILEQADFAENKELLGEERPMPLAIPS